MKKPISSLEGKRLNSHILHVDNISPGRFIEETNFDLYLKTAEGEISENPATECKHFAGRGEFYRPWLEVHYENHVKFKPSKDVNLSEGKLDERLFGHLSSLLSPGSHIMVDYLNHDETRKSLEHGVPAPATQLGYLLWRAGCTSFKDWYFAEGFWEGNIKLQGNKPLNEEDRRKNLLETRRELTEFLKREKSDMRLLLDARGRAEDLLKEIAREISGG
jgi:hypothetical protein